MLNKYTYLFLILSPLLAQNSLPEESGCTSPGPACALAERRVIETPAGAINGKNAVFTLSRQPADGSSVSLFKTGLPLSAGTDYKVIERQILVSTIPQPGDVLQAVYSPMSLLESKRSAQATLAPSRQVKGGDLPEIVLRGALDAELGAFGKSHSGALVTGGSASFPLPPQRSIKLSEEMLLNTNVGGFDGLGDGAATSRGSRKLENRTEVEAVDQSKALDMLEIKSQNGLTGNAVSKSAKKRQ